MNDIISLVQQEQLGLVEKSLHEVRHMLQEEYDKKHFMLWSYYPRGEYLERVALIAPITTRAQRQEVCRLMKEFLQHLWQIDHPGRIVIQIENDCMLIMRLYKSSWSCLCSVL